MPTDTITIKTLIAKIYRATLFSVYDSRVISSIKIFISSRLEEFGFQIINFISVTLCVE